VTPRLIRLFLLALPVALAAPAAAQGTPPATEFPAPVESRFT
jgi:hypothetical protein